MKTLVCHPGKAEKGAGKDPGASFQKGMENGLIFETIEAI